MEQHDGMDEDRDVVLSMLMNIFEEQPHALYSAGIDPAVVSDLQSLSDQVCVLCVRVCLIPKILSLSNNFLRVCLCLKSQCE